MRDVRAAAIVGDAYLAAFIASYNGIKTGSANGSAEEGIRVVQAGGAGEVNVHRIAGSSGKLKGGNVKPVFL